MAKRMVVVTTSSKGVFYGNLVDQKGDVAFLENAKMCVYWGTDLKGVMGLAKIGPTNSCRITPEVPKIELNGITAIIDCHDDAINAWRMDQWN